MTHVQTLQLAVIALAAVCMVQAIALLWGLFQRRRRHSFVEQYPTVRRIPSTFDPKRAPARAIVEAPSSATVDPAVAEQRLAWSTAR